MSLDHAQVPKTIPRPVDDGLASHLLGSTIPADLSLVSTQGTSVKLAELPGLTVLFCYPRTGAPGEAVKPEWNNTPGARGCTAEACSYRDNFPRLTELGANAVFGLSVQDSAYQQEAKERLGLPYDLLSDEKLEFVKAMKMPVFEWEGKPLTKRITLALRDGKVEHAWYPVFPPDENSAQVAAWLGAK
ncbi:thioredoxin-like protein [Ilyonectria destructans]|nr:thioredoxin-like protein [Ilyonectria destructans]